MAKGYTIVMTMGLTLVAAKRYILSSTNSLEKSNPTELVFFILAMACYAIASVAETNLTTSIIYHVSAFLACQMLLHFILLGLWCGWFYIINALILLVTILLFKNTIIGLLRNINPTTDQMQDLETGEVHILLRYLKQKPTEHSKTKRKKDVLDICSAT
ncbi:hypothetical protein CR513_55424, partial [Mucuna pruriens]